MIRPHARVASHVLLPLLCLPVAGQGDGWRTPPAAIRDCIEAPPAPSASVSPDRSHLLLSAREGMPSLAVQSRPILRLAGLRLDPATHGRQRGARTTGYTLVAIDGGQRRAVKAPRDTHLGSPVWTADGSRFAFTSTDDQGIGLWVADVATGESRAIDGLRLNSVLGQPVTWMPDQRRLLCRLVASDRPAPRRSSTPPGPNVQESDGVRAPVRTYQDLLGDAHDEALFAYYTTSQLAVIDPADGSVEHIGEPRQWTSVRPSPDGRFFLTTALSGETSYLVTYRSFPKRVSVLARDGQEVYRLADLPMAENVPIGGVLPGPRGVQWIPTEPHTLVWAEALDDGDPAAQVPHRDRLMVHDLAEKSPPSEWHRLEHRYRSTQFGDGDIALVSEFDRDTRWSRTWIAHPRRAAKPATPLFDRSTQDAYGDPGRPLTRTLANGFGVLAADDGKLFFSGSGASPEGDRPFLDRYQVGGADQRGDKLDRLFHCRSGYYETVVAMLTRDGGQLLIRRESTDVFPNYVVVDQTSGSETQLTQMTDPTKELTKKITKKLLTYDRADGVPLSATLYLPPDHRPGQRLPFLVWAYPREYNSASNAGQMRGSQHRYTRISGTSPLLLALHGYAVMHNAAMPIVGPVETANDTFVEQLVAGAKAAIDAAVKEGVADPDRAAIAGHSYGAFMTANLLAHSDLFRAGVARSGAYNRTLTPFGFQNERRTYWEAPEVYFAMSPFMHAPKINEPLLLIHGEVDNNSGTFPVQSKRLFHAVKGQGGTARLVMLPFESHGYRARESVMHCMAETVDWLDQHVKRAGGGSASDANATRTGR